MKKIIAIVLITAFYFTNCKKNETPPQTQTQSQNNQSNVPQQPDSLYYTLTVQSNYKRSVVTVDNLTDSKVIKRFNSTGGTTADCPISYSFWAKTAKKYQIHTYSTKNSVDSTLHMTDGNKAWNKLTVKTGTTTVYNKQDSVFSTSGWYMTSNTCILH